MIHKSGVRQLGITYAPLRREGGGAGGGGEGMCQNIRGGPQIARTAPFYDFSRASLPPSEMSRIA